jgi:hypothetical protein
MEPSHKRPGFNSNRSSAGFSDELKGEVKPLSDLFGLLTDPNSDNRFKGLFNRFTVPQTYLLGVLKE